MNATRAASIRLRAAFDGAVSLGRVQTPTLALVARREEEIRAFKPEPYWLVEAKFAASGERTYSGRYMGGKRIAEDEAAKIVEEVEGPGRHHHQAGEEGGDREVADPLRPDLAPAPRQHAAGLLGAPHAVGGAEALRGAQGAHLPANQLALPDRRHGRRDQADRELVGANPQYKKASEYVVGLDKLPLQQGDQRRQGRGPPRDHPDQRRQPARPVEDGRGRAEDLRPGDQAVPVGLPPRRHVRAHARRDHRVRARVPHLAAACSRSPAGGRCTARRSTPRATPPTTPAATRTCPSSSRARTWTRARSSRCARRPSRRGASPRRRCWPRWRRPARRSRTPSCATRWRSPASAPPPRARRSSRR